MTGNEEGTKMDSENMTGSSTKSPSEHSEPLPQKLEGVPAGPLDWDGPDDPDNPWNWPSSKRWFGTIVPGCFCLLVYVPTDNFGCGKLELY